MTIDEILDTIEPYGSALTMNGVFNEAMTLSEPVKDKVTSLRADAVKAMKAYEVAVQAHVERNTEKSERLEDMARLSLTYAADLLMSAAIAELLAG